MVFSFALNFLNIDQTRDRDTTDF